MCAKYPALNPPVVDGLVREGETANIISYSKIGKSWLAYSLALSVINGSPWLDRFPTEAGRVLLVDNELHPATIANRIPVVSAAMRLDWETSGRRLDCWSLRGKLRSLEQLAAEDFAEVEPGRYKLVIFDAKYRFTAPGGSENDNAAEARFYNKLDEVAERTRAALVLIHHPSKGGQGDKRVTDVGAGAGAQSRAADCHLVLREHQDLNSVILEAAVRSFPPVTPLALRWSFPLWIPVAGLNTGLLKGKPDGRGQRQTKQDQEGIGKIVKALQTGGPATVGEIRKRTQLSKERIKRLLVQLGSAGRLSSQTSRVFGNDAEQFALMQGPVADVVDDWPSTLPTTRPPG